MNSSNPDFASRICALRKGKNLSQVEFGNMLGVSNKAVSKWENGESLPQMKTIIKMAEIFEINPNELLVGTRYDAKSDNENNEKIDFLKNENEKLHIELNGAKEKRKRILFAISAFLILMVGVIIIIFSQSSKESVNADSAFIGESNSYILFSEKTFRPANDFQKYILAENDYIGEEKYGEIYNSEDAKNGEKITINCKAETSFISVTKNKEKYYYVLDGADISLSPNSIISINLYDNDYYPNHDPGSYNSYISGHLSPDGVEYFCKMYDEKIIPENSKELVEKNFETFNYVLYATCDDGNEQISANLGQFFKDKDGNFYFYSYIDSNTYSMGKELKNYVK